jgi:hypothetical protein
LGKGTTSVVPSGPENSPASAAAAFCFIQHQFWQVASVLGRYRP